MSYLWAQFPLTVEYKSIDVSYQEENVPESHSIRISCYEHTLNLILYCSLWIIAHCYSSLIFITSRMLLLTLLTDNNPCCWMLMGSWKEVSCFMRWHQHGQSKSFYMILRIVLYTLWYLSYIPYHIYWYREENRSIAVLSPRTKHEENNRIAISAIKPSWKKIRTSEPRGEKEIFMPYTIAALFSSLDQLHYARY